MPKRLLLGVNIDHVATLRQVRGERYPDPVHAALQAELAGADGITLHLREDRRHIQDDDVRRLRPLLQTRMNLEMAVTPFMIRFAGEIRPQHICLVPERREELTTEGGLNVAADLPRMRDVVQGLQDQGAQVSLFIDPEPDQIEAVVRTGADAVEFHTGAYATSPDSGQLERIRSAIERVDGRMIVNAGHGLNYDNVAAIAALPGLHELNIGHAIIARAVMTGLAEAVQTMRQRILDAVRG